MYVLTTLLLRMAWQLIFTATLPGGTSSHGHNLYLPPGLDAPLQPSFCLTWFPRLHKTMICKVCKILTTTHFIQEHKCVFTTPGNLCILIYSSERFSPTFSILGGYSEPRPRVQVISTVCGLAARKNLHSLLNFLLFESGEQCSLKRVCTMSVPLICGDLMLCNSKTYLQIRFLCRLKTRISREEKNSFTHFQNLHVLSRICSYPCYYNHQGIPTKKTWVDKWDRFALPLLPMWIFSLERYITTH